jgi:oligogalacturonide lyase
MQNLNVLVASLLLLASAAVSVGQKAADAQAAQTKIIPFSWTDADNGYHVIRLTNDPGSSGLESHSNAFTPDGKDMIYRSEFGIRVLSLATRKVKTIVPGRVESLAVGTKTRRVFFTRGTDIYLYVADIDTGAITKVGNLPLRANVMSVNSDETLLVGDNIEGVMDPNYQAFHLMASKEVGKELKADPTLKLSPDEIEERTKDEAMKMRAAANIPEDLFTVDLQTGRVTTILKTTDWIGYAQFSPTDPTLILYTHEGMYYETNRVWTIRSDGSQNQLIHQRTAKEESATKEFWSPDGKTIWYEWQKPRNKNFAMVAYDVATGERRLFKMEKDQRSISYCLASGGFIVGAGRNSEAARRAASEPGHLNLQSKQSIEILYPVLADRNTLADPQFSGMFNTHDEMTEAYPDARYAGWFRRATIVSMVKNDYTKLEPNIRVSPDNRLVIFTSNMLGPTYIFAVELH